MADVASEYEHYEQRNAAATQWGKLGGTAALVLAVGAGGVSATGSLHDITVSTARIEQRIEAASAWHAEHEARQHPAEVIALGRESDERRASDAELSARIGSIELALESLRGQLAARKK